MGGRGERKEFGKRGKKHIFLNRNKKIPLEIKISVNLTLNTVFAEFKYLTELQRFAKHTC